MGSSEPDVQMIDTQVGRQNGTKVEPSFMGQILSIACRARLKGDNLTIHVGLVMSGSGTARVMREKIAVEPLLPPVDGYVFLGRLTTTNTEESVIGRHTETEVFEFPKSPPYRHVVLMCNDEVCAVATVEWEDQP